MAVVIQEMVDAEAAGVLFSRNPIDGDPSKIVITANFGLGESVVSAKSDPDTIIVEKCFRKSAQGLKILQKKCGLKSKKIVMNDTETIEIDLDESAASNLAVNDDMILRLAKLSIILETAFGSSRDIEFAIIKVSMSY